MYILFFAICQMPSFDPARYQYHISDIPNKIFCDICFQGDGGIHWYWTTDSFQFFIIPHICQTVEGLWSNRTMYQPVLRQKPKHKRILILSIFNLNSSWYPLNFLKICHTLNEYSYFNVVFQHWFKCFNHVPISYQSLIFLLFTLASSLAFQMSLTKPTHSTSILSGQTHDCSCIVRILFSLNIQFFLYFPSTTNYCWTQFIWSRGLSTSQELISAVQYRLHGLNFYRLPIHTWQCRMFWRSISASSTFPCYLGNKFKLNSRHRLYVCRAATNLER